MSVYGHRSRCTHGLCVGVLNSHTWWKTNAYTHYQARSKSFSAVRASDFDHRCSTPISRFTFCATAHSSLAAKVPRGKRGPEMHAPTQNYPFHSHLNPDDSHVPAHMHWQNIVSRNWLWQWWLLWLVRHGFFIHSLRNVWAATVRLDLCCLVESVLVVGVIPN